MSAGMVEDLRQEIEDGRAIVIAGAGVAIAASGGDPRANWTGLMEDALRWCQDHAHGQPGWPEIVGTLLANGDVDSLFVAAETLTRWLGGRTGGDYRRWLDERVGPLPLVDRSVPEALAGLGVPLATTNYDDLIERATGWGWATWRDGPRVTRALRADPASLAVNERAVLHLHGHWDDPESVVLGIRSYDALLNNQAAQALQRAMGTQRTVVLVGMGAGASDPNLGALQRWLATTFPGAEHRHYRLCLEGEVEALWAEHPPGEWIVPLPYGDRNEDLAGFLRGLARPASAPTAVTAAPPTTQPASPGFPAPVPGAQIAGYLPDDISGRDLLDIDTEVNALAMLVASRTVEPPLSIGLFGDWGSGKSFFMNRLHRRIERLAHQSRAAPSAPSMFCANVIQIRFNAWHYIDASLWASLASGVFDGLTTGLADLSAKPSEATMRLIEEVRTSTESMRAARENLASAARMRQKAQDRWDQRRRALESMGRRSLGELLSSEPELKDAVDHLQEALGKSASELDLNEVRELRREMANVGGRARVGVLALWTRRRRLVIVLAAALAVAAAGLVALTSAWQWFVTAGGLALVAGLLTLAGAARGPMSSLLKALTEIIDTENAREDLREQRVLERTARQEMENAQRCLDEATARLERVSSVNRQELHEFIKERYTSADYRRELGIVAHVQRDFMALSELLSRGSPGDDVLPGVDRIVLYIDDLDRCPPARVVEVLQAVHLLLAFPLFVVVVGVDSRWLLRSLEQEYARLLSGTDGNQSARAHDEEDPWSSTAQSYLEKIFQIPYWLAPMTADGYRNLVRQVPVAASSGAGAPAPEVGVGEPVGAPPARPLPSGTDGQATSEIPNVIDEAPGATLARGVRDEMPLDDELIDLHPAGLLLDQRERDFIEHLAPLIRTPRSAKRLLNIYRLLRVQVAPDQLTGFLDGMEYRAVLLLLAMLIGFPLESAEVFTHLREGDASRWHALVDSLVPAPIEGIGSLANSVRSAMTASEAASWTRLVAAVRQTCRPDEDLPLQPFRDWVGRVGRFSFHAGRMVIDERPD